MHFDHAGIATTDATALAEGLGPIARAEVAHEETLDGMQVVFLDLGNGYFELLEPVDDDNAIASYLEDAGPGIHHLALETEDVSAALETARKHGVEPIDDEPRPGAWGHEVAFLHPRDTGGVLLEYVEH